MSGCTCEPTAHEKTPAKTGVSVGCGAPELVSDKHSMTPTGFEGGQFSLEKTHFQEHVTKSTRKSTRISEELDFVVEQWPHLSDQQQKQIISIASGDHTPKPKRRKKSTSRDPGEVRRDVPLHLRHLAQSSALDEYAETIRKPE